MRPRASSSGGPSSRASGAPIWHIGRFMALVLRALSAGEACRNRHDNQPTRRGRSFLDLIWLILDSYFGRLKAL